MKRRLLVTAFFPPQVGGIEDTLRILAGLAPAETVVLTPPHPDAEAFDAAQPWRTIRTPFFKPGQWPSWLSLRKELERVIQEERIEVVIFGHYAPYAIFGERLRQRFGVETVIYTHGLDCLAYTKSAAHRFLLRRALRQASQVWTNSEWTRRQLGSLVSSWRLRVLYPPVEPNSVSPTPVPHNHTFISIGRLERIKGYDIAVRTLDLLRKKYPDVRYKIVGEGTERSALQALAEKLGVDSAIEWHGALTPTARAQAILESSVVVQPSRSILQSTYVQAESFGLVAAQAGLLKRPVVASAVGGVPEVVQDQITGRLVHPDDPPALAQALAELWSDPAQAERLGEAAQHWVSEQFSAAHFAQRVAKALEPPGTFPKISVCIPAWNAIATLRPTLESLLAQDYPNLEIIVADDGSRDGTQDVVRNFPKVRLVQSQHGGAAQARNVAAAAATGEYLYFSDSDCIHRPNALSVLWRALENHPQAAFAYSSFRLGWKKFRLRSFSVPALRQQNYISTRALIRRAAFPGYDPNIRRLQDWDLWLRLAAQGKHAVWVDSILYRSVVSARTMSSGWFPKFLYRFPAIADRLSRGAGFSLREAEAIIREKHRLQAPSGSDWPDWVCPQCGIVLTSADESWHCAKCGVQFSIVDAIPQLLHPAFMDEFKKTEIQAHSEVLNWKATSVGSRSAPYHRAVKKFLQSLPSDSLVLEVAAGERPDVFDVVRNSGHRAIITDIAPERVERARTSAQLLNMSDRLRFAVADGEYLPVPPASVDAVLIAASFHHFPVPAHALQALRRVVKPGGLIVLELEPQRWPYRTLFRWLKPVQKVLRGRELSGHVHSVGDDQTEGFSRQQLQALAQSDGLEVLFLQPAKLTSELLDQAVRLAGKILRRTWQTPPVIHYPLAYLDSVLLRLPGIRQFGWHWNCVLRVP